MAGRRVTREAAVQVQRRVQEDLFQRYRPNLIDVDFKRVAGQTTDELAICLWFTRKQRHIASQMRVPLRIDGIRTDVRQGKVVSTADYYLKLDPLPRRPLTVGCAIGCYLEGKYSGGEGSLGCFVRDTSSGKIMILSNYHVLMKEGFFDAGVVLQPPQKWGGDSSKPVARYVRGALGGDMDAAVAALEPDVKWQNVTADGLQLRGRGGPCKIDDTVKKHGPATGLTSGIVTSLSAAFNRTDWGKVPMRNLIRVAPMLPLKLRSPGALGNKKYVFQYSGDSGSALLDRNDRIVGLMHSAVLDPDNEDFGCGFASPIDAVLSRLRVELA